MSDCSDAEGFFAQQGELILGLRWVELMLFVSGVLCRWSGAGVHERLPALQRRAHRVEARRSWPLTVRSMSSDEPQDWKSFFPRSEFLYEDSEVIAFDDIRPRAKEHILVIPKTHIVGTESLTSKHFNLVTKMHKVGRELLTKRVGSASDKFVFGFHQFPLRSVNHLHLHCIDLPYNDEIQRFRFTEWLPGIGFISVKTVLDRIQPS